MYATREGVAVEDLRRDEVEVLEDGVRQTIDSFEFIKVAPAGRQETRREPSTLAEMREMARTGRARVFVIFLDTYHTQPEGSANMRTPLVRFLDRVLGEDDLIALMTPDMPATSLTFGRKTTIISNFVNHEWWGRRDTLLKDPKERLYEACYGTSRIEPNDRTSPSIADVMTERRRERLTLDALDDLIQHLGGIREERKAVLTVTEGWRLFTEDSRLARVDSRDTMAGPPRVAPGGRGGAPQRGGGVTVATLDSSECETDRAMLAAMDNSRRLIDAAEDANRANVSFYPVFARGLTGFDAPIGPARPPSPLADRANLAARQNSMRELADLTDGTSVIDTNQIERALTRIAADLFAYYLLSYSSTNQRLDGRFREIRVRVNRPGVQVRARRGYRGLTAEELTGMQPSGGAAVPAASAFSVPVNPRAAFRARTSGWTTAIATVTTASVWLVGELDAATRRELAWTAGSKADIAVVAATGGEVATTSVDIAAEDGAFALQLPIDGGLVPGEYAVRVRVQPAASGAVAVSDTVRLIVPAAVSVLGEPVFWRRGTSTGPRFAPTADPRYRRSDRIRLELPTRTGGEATARMLDRLGRPMQVPVQASERQDASGQFRWIIAEAVLAPLAPGDYAIEVMLGDAKQHGTFRVVP
jgi:VWFA-related protein